MDRVRFGRALGFGARAAAKSLMSAAEAATAPTPAPRAGTTQIPKRTDEPTRPTVNRASIPSQRVVKVQAGNLKRSVWIPFAKFSTVLWLEVTGLFFAIFALIAAQQIWKIHAAIWLPPTTPQAQRLYVYIILFAVFAYFTISSFVRANRRQRR